MTCECGQNTKKYVKLNIYKPPKRVLKVFLLNCGIYPLIYSGQDFIENFQNDGWTKVEKKIPKYRFHFAECVKLPAFHVNHWQTYYYLLFSLVQKKRNRNA